MNVDKDTVVAAMLSECLDNNLVEVGATNGEVLSGLLMTAIAVLTEYELPNIRPGHRVLAHAVVSQGRKEVAGLLGALVGAIITAGEPEDKTEADETKEGGRPAFDPTQWGHS